MIDPEAVVFDRGQNTAVLSDAGSYPETRANRSTQA